MSDTPRTDAMETALLWRTGEVLQADVEFANFARDLERENARLQEQIAALGEIGCLNLDDSTVAECDAVTGGEKYKDVLRRLFVEQPKEIAELRSLLREAITSLARHRAAMAKEDKP